MLDLVNEILEGLNDLEKELRVVQGQERWKASGRRARVLTIALEKKFKDFRKKSVIESNK